MTTSATVAPAQQQQPAAPKAKTAGGAKIPKPDQQAHRRQIDDINAQIKKLQEKQEKFKEEWAQLSGSGEAGQKRTELRQKMDELKKRQAEMKEARGKILDTLKYAQDVAKKRMDDIKAAKERIPFKSVYEVDRRINELEQMVASASLKIVEEKRVLSEISALRKSRKSIESFDPQEDAIQGDKKKIEELKGKLDQFEPENKRLQKEFGQVLGELRALDAVKEEGTSKRKKLQAERDAVRAELDSLFDRRRTLTDEFKKANDVWYESQREERARRAEEMKKQRLEVERQRKLDQIKKARELAEIPAFESEISTCNVLVAYLQQWIGETPAEASTDAAETAAPEKPKSTRPVSEAAPALPKGVTGTVALKKKSDRIDEDNYLMFGNGGNKKKAPKATKEKDVLKLDLDMMNQFVSLQVAVPSKIADVPQAIAALQDKKKYYKENQEQVTKENIEKAKALEEKLLRELEEKEKNSEENGAVVATETEEKEDKPEA